ncbi:phosphatidylinositol-specific phospholipase C [Streptomyces chryseus]|uniref:1-phosphatidylinositol phosphodiesterase n=1 Tax=Streptomyces chryseus TaxID=68186 RepID=A0ABQ3DKA1_9ACTN|nr:phosphatidylinositol-specific phospholipase C [Streptomyces chryseus]GHA97127.1 1-phosphatidylinositol phosphodiesterase [Streptomyces chryseus]
MSVDRRTFLTGAAAVSATALLGSTGAVAAPRTLSVQDWMAGLGDSTPIQRLTIPGTHDSGARVGGPWVACQNTAVADQLRAGIRFLDVRCRVTGDSFAIHHGAYYQNLMFGDVLIACRDFLRERPSETVLMRVKQEYSEAADAEFRRIFDLYLDGKGWRPLFRIDAGLPALGQARGRVVLLADNGGLPGVRYGDPALFDIQDDYMAEPGAKYPKIEAHFRKAAQQPGKLFLNYVSTSALLPPRWNSDRLNPRVHGFLDGAEAGGWTGLGVVPMDFPNTRPGLVESLIRHNAGSARRSHTGEKRRQVLDWAR